MNASSLQNYRPAHGTKTAELLAVIEQLRGELQTRTDGVNAIQRNFERLSEMYRRDCAELERLREGERQMKERDAAIESERKVFAAMQKEMESLLQSYKDLHETRRHEQQTVGDSTKAMQQKLEEQQTLLAHLQNECDRLRGQTEASEEKQKRLASEFSDSARHVLQFVSEIQGRVRQLPLDYMGGDRSNSSSIGVSGSHSSFNSNTITAALSDAWDCVDAMCIALRRTCVEMERMARERIEEDITTGNRHIFELEGAMRLAITQEEVSWREMMHTMHHDVLCSAKGEKERSLRLALQEELVLVRCKLQEQRNEHDAVVSALKRNLTEVHDRLQKTQEDFALLQQRNEVDVTAREQSLRQQASQLLEELQQLERRRSSEEAAAREEQTAALRGLKERLAKEHGAREKHWQGRVDRLEEELRQLKAAALAARSEATELHATKEAACDVFCKRLAEATSAHQVTFVQDEAVVRGGIAELERAQREALLRQAFDQREQMIAAAATATAASATVLLRTTEADEMMQRLLIALDETAASPVLDCQRRLFGLRLHETRRVAATEAHCAQRARLEGLRVKLQSLRRQMSDISRCFRGALEEQCRLSSRAHELTEQVEASHAASVHALQRQQQAAAAASTVVQRLMAAEEASESAYSCGLCLRIYRKPVTCAPCGHTFCETCFLQHPKNKLRASESVRYCPECCLATNNTLVRVRALEMLSGNFTFRQKEMEELQRVLTVTLQGPSP